MLKQIIENKRKEVELAKKSMPLNTFKSKIQKSTRNFKEALSQNKLNLIAEFKRNSPSGNINKKQFNMSANRNAISEHAQKSPIFDIQNIIKIYTQYADAVSVLTDKKFFSGSLEDMKDVSNLTHLPILRKDFIIDEYQIYGARLYGADAILLIASVLSKGQIDDFIDIAKSMNVNCLVEVHTEDELNKVLDTKAEIIGVNNRNLDTLEIDLNTTLRLADKIPSDKLIVSESGIKDNDYVNKIKNKVNAILVGSAFMNAASIENEIVSILK